MLSYALVGGGVLLAIPVAFFSGLPFVLAAEMRFSIAQEDFAYLISRITCGPIRNLLIAVGYFKSV